VVPQDGGGGTAGYLATRDTRHERAVARSLVHADLAAQDGDLREALAWLSVLDSMGDPLPAEYERKRRAWHAALRSHAR
jgi:hypothetical protein